MTIIQKVLFALSWMITTYYVVIEPLPDLYSRLCEFICMLMLGYAWHIWSTEKIGR